MEWLKRLVHLPVELQYNKKMKANAMAETLISGWDDTKNTKAFKSWFTKYHRNFERTV